MQFILQLLLNIIIITEVKYFLNTFLECFIPAYWCLMIFLHPFSAPIFFLSSGKFCNAHNYSILFYLFNFITFLQWHLCHVCPCRQCSLNMYTHTQNGWVESFGDCTACCWDGKRFLGIYGTTPILTLLASNCITQHALQGYFGEDSIGTWGNLWFPPSK